VRGPQGPRLQEAALLAIGGHRLGRQEVELHHLHAGRGQRVLERAPRAALRHHNRRRARHVPQVSVLRGARKTSLPWKTNQKKPRSLTFMSCRLGAAVSRVQALALTRCLQLLLTDTR